MIDHEMAAEFLLRACGILSPDDAHTHAGDTESANEMWTEHCKELELTIHKEKMKDCQVAVTDLLSQEAHLS